MFVIVKMMIDVREKLEWIHHPVSVDLLHFMELLYS